MSVYLSLRRSRIFSNRERNSICVYLCTCKRAFVSLTYHYIYPYHFLFLTSESMVAPFKIDESPFVERICFFFFLFWIVKNKKNPSTKHYSHFVCNKVFKNYRLLSRMSFNMLLRACARIHIYIHIYAHKLRRTHTHTHVNIHALHVYRFVRLNMRTFANSGRENVLTIEGAKIGLQISAEIIRFHFTRRGDMNSERKREERTMPKLKY